MDRVKKTSWEYQKGKYKQVNIKFNMDDPVDVKVYNYLKDGNATRIIKSLVLSVISPCYGCMGAAYLDCEECDKNEIV